MFLHGSSRSRKSHDEFFFGEMGDQGLIMIVLEMLWYLTLLTAPIDII